MENFVGLQIVAVADLRYNTEKDVTHERRGERSDLPSVDFVVCGEDARDLPV